MSQLLELLNTTIDRLPLVILCIAIFAATAKMSMVRIKLIDSSYGDKAIQSIFFLVICALPMGILIGLRGIDVGYDTTRYIASYNNLLQQNIDTAISFYSYSYGPVFTTIVWFLNKIGGPLFCQFIVTQASLMFLIDGFTRSRDIAKPSWAIFVFCLYLGLNYADQARQMLALSIAISAFGYLRENSKSFFVALSALSISIHPATISFTLLTLLFFLIEKTKTSHPFILAGLVMASAALPGLLVSLISTLLQSTRFLSYVSEQAILDTQLGINSGFGYIIALLPILLPIVLYYRHLKKNSDASSSLIICSSFGVPFRLLGYYANWLGRLFSYPLFFSSLLTSSAIHIERDGKLTIDAFAFLFCIGSTFLYFLTVYVYANNHGFFPLG